MNTTASTTLRTLLAAHQAELQEWDPATLDAKFRDSFVAFACISRTGRRVVVVPAGQDPAVRLAAVRALLDDLRQPEHGTA